MIRDWSTSTLRVISAGDPGAPSAAIPPLPRKVRVARPATGTLTGAGRSCSPCNRDPCGAGRSCNPCNRYPDRRRKVLQGLQPAHPSVTRALSALEPLPWPRQLAKRGRRRRIGTWRSRPPGGPSWAVRPGDGRRGELGKDRIVSCRHHGRATLTKCSVGAMAARLLLPPSAFVGCHPSRGHRSHEREAHGKGITRGGVVDFYVGSATCGTRDGNERIPIHDCCRDSRM